VICQWLFGLSSPPPTRPVFAPLRNPGPTLPLHVLMLTCIDVNENGDTVPSTTSEVILIQHKKLDPHAPIFSTSAAKTAFVRTIPSAMQLQLEQPLGKDNLNQWYYLQKCGHQALHLLYISGFMTNSIKKELERAFPPTRWYRQLARLYQNIDFRSMQGFQPDWQKQTKLSVPQREMTTACLLHFNLSLPAMVLWIGGPHVDAHRDNTAIFARLKETCDNADYKELVRVFTQGSPTYINAECPQANYKAYRVYGNHSSFMENTALLAKTLLKDVARGCTLMLDPDIMDFLENVKQTPHGIVNLEHLYKNPRVVCDATCRPHCWSHAINDWMDKTNEPPLTFAGAFVATLTWIWNLHMTYPHLEIYVCDDDITNAFRQIKYPPNLAGLHCKIAKGVMFVDTGQTFGNNTSPSNFEAVPNCRSQHAHALWHRLGTIARALPLLLAIAHQDPPTLAEAASFVQANRDSLNPGALDALGNRCPPVPSPRLQLHLHQYFPVSRLYRLRQRSCSIGNPRIPQRRSNRRFEHEKLDTMYRPQRTTVGYRLDTRAMTVGLLQYKRDETVEVIEPWLTTPSFTLLQGAVLCGKLKSAFNYNRWIRPYFFSVQNTIRAALTTKWKKIQGYYTRMGIAKVKAKYGLPKNLERRLLPLIARDKALLLWHSKATFAIPAEVKQDLALIQGWLHDRR
jgi:hypothetical protein